MAESTLNTQPPTLEPAAQDPYAEILKKPNGKMKLAEWYLALGLTGDNQRKQAIDLMASIPDAALAKSIMQKLEFGDFAMINAQAAGARTEAAKPQMDPNKKNILTALGLGGAAAGAVGAAEIAGRLAEILNGNEQTYRGAIDLVELKKQFEGALSDTDIRVSFSPESSSTGNYIFRDNEGNGVQLLTVRVRNHTEKATAAQTAYDAVGTRSLPLAEVQISKSDMGHLLNKGVETAGSIAAGLSELSNIKNMSGAMDALQATFAAGKETFDAGKEAFDVGNLPRLVADVIEKMARQAEDDVSKQTAEIYKRNLNRLQEVSGGLVCLYCGRPRPDSDADPSCGGCGAPLEKRHEPVAVLKADIVRLAEVGLIKAA